MRPRYSFGRSAVVARRRCSEAGRHARTSGLTCLIERVPRQRRAGLVRLVLARAADRELDESSGDGAEDDHEQSAEGVPLTVVASATRPAERSRARLALPVDFSYIAIRSPVGMAVAPSSGRLFPAQPPEWSWT